MSIYNDQAIIRSWKKNATPWADAIRGSKIESRVQVTNKAIEDTILSVQPTVSDQPISVLDIGCGEGWLVRSLSAHGFLCTGTDVIPELLNTARQDGGGRFFEMAYEDISEKTISEKFDIAVCNFSLIGKESVEHLFGVLPSLLNTRGYFIVQTLYPGVSAEIGSYENGWRKGSWDGFGPEFSDPAPWYFRTIEAWVTLFTGNGFELLQLREPVSAAGAKPQSLILVGRTKT